mmetsp:Transcript_26868/g.70577  ORF Transcript_26868/g.70577 Transcript_26868/m.70577 type:complete len:88 (-) Transcript_26868:221-484(-)
MAQSAGRLGGTDPTLDSPVQSPEEKTHPHNTHQRAAGATSIVGQLSSAACRRDTVNSLVNGCNQMGRDGPGELHTPSAEPSRQSTAP